MKTVVLDEGELCILRAALMNLASDNEALLKDISPKQEETKKILRRENSVIRQVYQRLEEV